MISQMGFVRNSFGLSDLRILFWILN
jgi:hypothetical protein